MLVVSAIGVFLLFEIAYTVNNQIIPYPLGPQPWFASLIRLQNANEGYSELDAYLESEFAGKAPAWVGTKYAFIDQIRSAAIQSSIAHGDPVVPFAIFYDGYINGGAEVWIMTRHLIYDGWFTDNIGNVPAVCIQKVASPQCPFSAKYIYVVLIAGKTYPIGLVNSLEGAELIPIKNPRGDVVLNVYKITTVSY